MPSGVSGVLVADLFSLGLDRSSLGGMGSGQYPSEKLVTLNPRFPEITREYPSEKLVALTRSRSVEKVIERFG